MHHRGWIPVWKSVATPLFRTPTLISRKLRVTYVTDLSLNNLANDVQRYLQRP
ncbi:hypothetical protein WN48_00069 [Eufriesea mexicana]|nr:hypothetical protein WN48_00069 [Eufriesea mexicana]